MKSTMSTTRRNALTLAACARKNRKIGDVTRILARGALILSCLFALPTRAAEFWVSLDGDDHNPGTQAKPFASIAPAQRQARELRRRALVAANESVRIILRGGVYQLASPLLFRSEDSGTETSPTIVEAATNEQPVLSGGVLVERWERPERAIHGLPSAAQGKVWMADVPKFGERILGFRQLWVNGHKAIRAREPNGDTLERLLVWDEKNGEAWIPAAPVAAIRDASGMEMVIDQIWEIAMLRVNTLRFEGDKACLTFEQPESRIEFEHPWPPVVMTTNYHAPFFLANAIEFLDEPGEWFADMRAGKVYYWPRPGEDMTRAKVVVPALETLVQVEGSLDRLVSHLHFKQIGFEYTTWMRPSDAGHVPLQAGMFLLDAYRLSPKGTAYDRGLDNQAWIGRPPAGVSVSRANHIAFERCRFEHMASAGLDFQFGTHDDLIEGGVFHDVGGNGIQMGKFSDAGIETHVPYNPTDEREICSRERIANNLVTGCGNEDWGCVGICVGYGRGIVIEHNEINDLPYTGISVGWGWTKAENCMRDNVINANHVHHVATRLGDTGGIYTLSAQPGTVVSENSVHDIRMSPYVPDPEHWFYLYLDEGSSFITVRDNWCPAEKFMKNANGPGNHWQNNGPMVSQKIRDAAGLEPPFRDLRSEPNY